MSGNKEHGGAAVPRYEVLRVKRLHPNAIIPKYTSPGAGGFDLHCLESVTIKPQTTVLVRTGLVMELPPGTEMQIRPCSEVVLKQLCCIPDSPSTVSADYQGEIMVIMRNMSMWRPLSFRAGDRVARGVVVSEAVRCVVVEVERDTDRQDRQGGE